MTLARDVAKELAKQQRRRKLLFLGVIGTLVVLAFLYLRCGAGWGLGGKGKGKGKGEGKGQGVADVKNVASPDAGPRRCMLRVDGAGLSLDGKPATQEAAVAACRDAGRAELLVVGDALTGTVEALEQALTDASIPYSKQQGAPR
jgi:hypothetical protein